jgi:hypothetical protein
MFEWITIAAIVFLSVIIEGWRLQPLDPTMRATFARWSQDIGELKHLDPLRPTLWSWIRLHRRARASCARLAFPSQG